MTGKIWKFGDNVDTDQIIATQYLLVPTVDEMVAYTFESIDPGFAEKCRQGDIIAGGDNFGCGSSREQAPMVLKALGVQAVIARSFARIFYRNAINIGLPVVVCPEAVNAVVHGESAAVDTHNGTVSANGREFRFTPFPENIGSILSAGGLLEYINTQGADSEAPSGTPTNIRPMTITEKLLANAAGKKYVRPGEIVTVPVNVLMTNDATTHVSVKLFEDKVTEKRIGAVKKRVGVIDHNVPAEQVKTAHVQNMMRRFCCDKNITLHDGEGVCHQILAENYIVPGDVVIGADSHTPASGAFGAFAAGVGSTDYVGALVTGKTWLRVPETIKVTLSGAFPAYCDARDLMLKLIGDIGSDGALYRAVEFCGEGTAALSIAQRITLCAMAVEAGAKNAVVGADETTKRYITAAGRTYDPKQIFEPDADAEYCRTLGYSLDDLVPAIAKPHFVHRYADSASISAEKIRIHQGFVGSCSTGGIEGLRMAAGILKGRKVNPLVKLVIAPASRKVMKMAVTEGLIEVFLEAGAMVMNPNCSVCWGASQGVLGDGEVMVSTGTRNFRGRAGSPDSFVYLGSAATVAASAIEGYITDPRRFSE